MIDSSAGREHRLQMLLALRRSRMHRDDISSPPPRLTVRPYDRRCSIASLNIVVTATSCLAAVGSGIATLPRRWAFFSEPDVGQRTDFARGVARPSHELLCRRNRCREVRGADYINSQQLPLRRRYRTVENYRPGKPTEDDGGRCRQQVNGKPRPYCFRVRTRDRKNSVVSGSFSVSLGGDIFRSVE
jgi:hypothetical protein